jgi:hypothetical protein
MMVTVVFAAAGPALAQSEPRFGVTAAFPSSIGVHWQATDKFAIRVDGSYTYSSTETSTNDDDILRLIPGLPGTLPLPTFSIETRTESHLHATSLAFSALFTIHQRDQFRLYIAPRVGVSWSQSEIRTTTTVSGLVLPPPGSILPDRTAESSATSPTAGASLGAVSRLGDRFGVFGELGFQYSKSDLGADFFTERSAIAAGTRASVGVIVFF